MGQGDLWVSQRLRGIASAENPGRGKQAPPETLTALAHLSIAHEGPEDDVPNEYLDEEQRNLGTLRGR